MRSYQQFFAELMRRKVFKVAAVYGAAAFVLLQMADLLEQGLRLGETFLPFITAIVLLGFPLALILAWAFEVTPDGVQRTGAAAAGEIEGILAQPASSRWPAGLMALAGIAALVAGAWWVGRQTAVESATASSDGTATTADVRLAFLDPSEDPRPSIAVLPFTDMSRDGDQGYFSDGITEEISSTLARIRELRVSARTSAFAYKNVQRDLREVGQELGVSYLLEGSVRKDGDQLRITAQLIDVGSDSHLWSEVYDRRLENIFVIQTEIAGAIAEALTIPLGLEEGESLVTPTADPEAFDLYLAARSRMRERGPSVLEAVELFEAAIARDSGWAPAWAGLAESQALVPFYAERGSESVVFNSDSVLWARQLDAADVAARTALALDPDNASATIALANVLRDRWEWEPAEEAYLRAINLDPDNVEVHQQYAEYLYYLGRLDEALTSARRALALDRSPIRLNVAGYVARDNGRFDEAIELLEAAASLDPDVNLHYVRTQLFAAYLQSGQWKRARETALGAAGLGREAAVRAVWPVSGPPPAGMNVDAWPGLIRERAFLLQVVGEHEKALTALQQWADLIQPFGSTGVLWMVLFDPIRDDPRFQAILEKRGLGGRRPIRAEP